MVLAAGANAEEGAAVQVGLTRFAVDNPLGGSAIATAAWYPTRTAAAPVLVGPYRIEAAPDAAPAAGRYPLIVFSHGTGGSASTITTRRATSSSGASSC